MSDSFRNLDKKSYYLIGIKGTGMTALAQYLKRSGAHVSGSDIPDTFYTDAILKKEGIAYYESFAASHITEDADAVIYSAAYSPETNAELKAAFASGKPVMVYPEALGAISAHNFAIGISGIHGKTTTTAIAGTLVDSIQARGAVIVGSGVRNFDGSQVLFTGDDFLIAETCEYRRHFLNFHPNIILVTSIEPDHLDYFKDYEDILNAFLEYSEKLPANGVLIYCAEDAGACELSAIVQRTRTDIRCIPYGGAGSHRFGIAEEKVTDGKLLFKVNCFGSTVFELSVPGHHTVLNAIGSMAAVCELSESVYGTQPTQNKLQQGISTFRGTTRRSEILFSNDDYLIMDDYAHHPTAIAVTIDGLKKMYPERRIVASFMSHTYSRTNALFDDFCHALLKADVLFLHKIYSSAREQKQEGSVEGIDLYNRVTQLGGKAFFYEEPRDSIEHVYSCLKPRDIFISLGAGDNWIVSHEIAGMLEKKLDD